MAFGDDGPEPTLVIKAPLLQLKYLLAVDQLTFSIVRSDGGLVAYAVEVPDDPVHPALLWSIVENEEEITALHALTDDSRCVLHLFNEIAVNVASAEGRFDLDPDKMRSLLADPCSVEIDGAARDTRDMVKPFLDQIQSGTLPASSGYSLEVALIEPWQGIPTHHVTNSLTESHLSIFDADEGGQQEVLGLWLTDSLTINGAILNPAVVAPSGARELCDVLFGYEDGTFLIESKTLALLARASLPTRDQLRSDVVKHIRKATKQLGGAVRYLRKGYPLRAPSGQELEVDRDNPMHLMILVPDLSLLTVEDNLGGEFLIECGKATGCFMHVLDPTALLRAVQVAATIAQRSSTVSEIAALDFYLLERWKAAIQEDTPNIDFLLRIGDELE